MRTLIVAATLGVLTIVALWWARAWAQYNADETTMDTAMHTREDNWDSDCS